MVKFLALFLAAILAACGVSPQYGGQVQQQPYQAAAIASTARLQSVVADIYNPPPEFDKASCPIGYGATIDVEENSTGVSWSKQASYRISCGDEARIDGGGY